MQKWRYMIGVVLGIALSGILYAGTTGKIVGKVVDKQTGEPLPGAGVIIQETGQGTATDLDGSFVIINVAPGTYTLRASYVGYQDMIVKNVQVDADRTTEVNFYLSPAALVESTVVVTAKPKAIKKDLTSSRTITTSKDVENLPVTDVTDIVTRQAGVTLRGGELHIRGGRPGEVSFSVDGIETKDPYTNFSTSLVPLLAMQEASVERGGFDVDQGSASSGSIQIITKEGSDKYEITLMPYTNDLSVFGDKIYSFFDANQGDPYLDFLTGTNPDLNSSYPRHKSQAKTLEFGVGGPIIPTMRRGPRFFVSGVLNKYKGRYPVSNDPNYYNHENNYQWKITWPLKNFKVFTSGLYRYRRLKGYSPAWRLALDNTDVFSESILQGSFGINYIPSSKQYVELRIGYFDRNFTDNVIEDADRDGIDDFADRDKNGFVEVDIDYFRDSLGNFVNIDSLYPGAIVHESEGYVELPYYWWESAIQNLYPSLGSGPQWWSADSSYAYFPYNRFAWGQRSNNDINIVTVRLQNGEIDTLIEMSGTYYQYPFIPDMLKMRNRVVSGITDSMILDTLLSVGNLYLPDPHTYPRSQWSTGYSKTNSFLLKYTGQVSKYHELLAGIEFKKMDVMRYGADYASGGNIYLTLVNNDFSERATDTLDNFVKWMKEHPIKPYQMAAYIRDKVEVEGMVAKFGLRFDYFNSGGYSISDSTDPFEYDPEWLTIRRIKNPKKAEGKWHISPRVGISFPISDRDVLHFTYGHYMQPPELSQLIGNYVFSGAFPIIGNANLDPELTISYEFGVKHAFNEYTLIDISAYYKDIKNWARLKMLHYGVTGNYSTYVNEDYGDVRGVEFSFSKRPGGGLLPYLGLDVNYTFQVALGTFSSPFDAYDWAWRGYPMPPHESPLDWDQRHSLQVALSFIVPRGKALFAGIDDWGITFDHQYGSGYPYTPPIKTVREAIENINAGRYPSTQNTNLRFFKNFRFMKGKMNLRLFADVTNLFNRKDLISAANIDWYVFFHDPEGETKDPRVWSAGRRTRVGLMLQIKGL